MIKKHLEKVDLKYENKSDFIEGFRLTGVLVILLIQILTYLITGVVSIFALSINLIFVLYGFLVSLYMIRKVNRGELIKDIIISIGYLILFIFNMLLLLLAENNISYIIVLLLMVFSFKLLYEKVRSIETYGLIGLIFSILIICLRLILIY